MRIKQWLAIGSMVLASSSGLVMGQSENTSPKTLRQAAGDRLLIGAAIMSQQLDEPKLAALIGDQFNCLTGENEFKVDSLQHEKGNFTFEAADKITDFAIAHNMKMIGHNLCWHNQIPAWMFANENKKPLSRDEALENLRVHIDTVVKHFKGKVLGWDVVNEAISDKGSEYLRDTPAKRAIGDDYVEKAFEFAHAADPDAELYYNDFNDEQQTKYEKVIRLVKSLKEKGIRIDCVGIQGHFMMKYPDPAMVDQAIEAISATGVKVMITEMDIDVLPRKTTGAEVGASEQGGQNPYKDGLPPEVAQAQADRYAELFRVFLKHPGVVTRVTLWGTHDGTSWLNSWPVRGRMNYPLLWDRDLGPKPAFFSVLGVLGSGK